MSDAPTVLAPDGAGDPGDVEPESAPAAFDPMSAYHAYHELSPGAERSAFWSRLTDEQRDELRDQGLAGPIAASVGDDFEAVRPGDDAFRATVRTAYDTVQSAVRALTNGRFDVDLAAGVADEIAELHAEADKWPTEHPRHYESIQ